MNNLFDREVRLRPGAVSSLRFLFACVLLLIAVAAVCWTAFRRDPKHRAFHRLELLFEELELHLGAHILATKASNVQTQFCDFFMLSDDGLFKVKGDLFEGFLVANIGHFRHAVLPH
jgi:hypothetical protein